MTNALHRLHDEQGQSPWIDFIDRDLLTSGRLAQLVDDGIRGLTKISGCAPKTPRTSTSSA